ncbi:VCBS domain-containing protein [Bradyrhizobium ottawaense]|uniref:VCBS domain-containing protein n=1 Tax=Bradyrhizobium ottawaense TaxID=931866 RepID=UPI001BA92842|nr:VCBS domain-containing protein [Bradyrhizobium ottawaense]MBR1331695.1 VCBS domain-containing protein [Bradyrhizobium ottawaense]
MNYAGQFDAAISLDGQGSRSPAGSHVDSFTAKAHGHVPEGAFVVPDPNLIFNGEFKRTGLDLVLSHEGHEFVVHDYFRGEKRAALASPDGAHLTGEIVNALTGHVQVAQAAPGGAAAAQVIGHVTKLVGSATAIRNGVSVILNNGDNVEKGDVVSTGADSTLGITFIDGTVFGLSSNARMVLNEMVYDPNGSSNSSLLSLVAGTITFVAGETAKHGDMKIDTPVATMGIRGTAVLTQINFVVPAGGGDPQPQASFQVLVEPNGTTGSYILFDKVTLLPIATVNQAGQMIQISGGNVSISNALMSPDVQKLITDVFTLKFTDNNTNTKLTTNFTDTLTPMSLDVVFKSGGGAVATATFVNLNPQGSEAPGTSAPPIVRIPGQPIVQSFDAGGNVKTAFALTERADATGDTHSDTISGLIRFVDQNLGDRPTVSISLAEAPNYVYKDAGQHDVTGSLSALQKQDIAATQIQINVAPDAANENNGSAVWTYTIPDKVFDFLAAGETLALTYMVRVDTNFSVSPESKLIPITITVTGTNDKPTVATSGGTVIEKVGTGNETLDTITGTVTFTDVDLTDRPIVNAALSSTQPFKYLDAEGNDITSTLTPQQLAAIAAVEVPLTVVQGAGNGNNGSATWTYSVPDHLFDFLAKGEKLTLNYVVQVDDGHGGVVSTPITVSINGADVNVEGTNDVPTIVEDDTIPTGAVTEDTAATLAANGIIAFNDPDLTDTHSASFSLKSTISSAHLPGFSDGTSHIGTFALAPVVESPGASSRGSVGWTFTLDDNDPVLQSLAEGQTITQVYTVRIDDHHGGTVTRDVTVVITGKNDAPTVTSGAAAATGHVVEDADLTLSIGGTLAIQDLDLIDTHAAQAVFKSSSISSALPGFDADSTHIGTFTIDQSVLEYNSDTSNGATLGWHFSLDNSNAMLQSLAQGQTITQVYTVTFDDHHGGTVSEDVTVTITGVNDAPTITSDAAAATGAVTEDESASLPADGILAIQDLDLTDTHTAAWSFKSSSVSSNLPGFGTGSHIGTFTIDAVSESSTDGNNGATLGWHFTLDNNDPVLQSLAEGQTITQVYTVTFDDQHGGKISQDVTVTITGTNDAPTVSYATSDDMGFDGHTIAVGAAPTVATDDVTLDGRVNWNGGAEAGHGQILFYNGNTSTTGFGLLGTVNANGTMELQILAGGVQIADTGVAIAASQWHNIALTRENGTFSLYLDGHLEYSQAWSVNPIDGSPSNPSHSYMMIGGASEPGAAGFGSEGFFGSIADVSVWTDALTQVQIQSIDFTALSGHETDLAAYYQLGGGSGNTVANSVNPAQSLDIDLADLKETNEGLDTHGVLTVSDVDATDHVTVSVSHVQAYLDGVLQTDSVGGLSNADLLADLTVPSGYILDGTATHTQFTWNFNSHGQAFDFLGAGQTLSLQYTIVPADGVGAGTGAVVTVNIAGSNDAPTLADLHIGPLSDTAAADTFCDLTGTLAGSDDDTGETATLTYAVINADHHAATTAGGLYGTLTVNPDGSYSYVPNAAAINALTDGSYADIFTVQTTDVHGATGTATLTVDVTGANEAGGPVIDTRSFQVEHIIENSNDIITDLVVVDTDAGAAADTFTVTLSTAHPDVSSVYFAPMTGSLGAINAGLASGGTGVVYDPTGASADDYPQPPVTDRVTLTVADSAGHSDTVNFIFVAGASSQDIILAGADGKDVIFATESNDTLIGGGAKDQFVFAPTSSQTAVQHTVNDFETGLDKIDLRQFTSITSWTQVSQHAAQQGVDTLLTLDSNDKILLKNTVVGNLHASDFIVHS